MDFMGAGGGGALCVCVFCDLLGVGFCGFVGFFPHSEFLCELSKE